MQLFNFSCFTCTSQKMKFSIKDFFSKYDQIRSFLRIWSHLLKKSFMENFIFCAVLIFSNDNVVSELRVKPRRKLMFWRNISSKINFPRFKSFYGSMNANLIRGNIGSLIRSSSAELFCRKGVLCQSLLFTKVADLSL